MLPQIKGYSKGTQQKYSIFAFLYSFALASASLYSSPKAVTLAGFMAMRIRFGTILLFVLLVAIWHGVFVMCGLYESKRLTTWRSELWELLRATCLASVLLLGMARMFHIFIVQSTFVLLFWIYCTSLMVSSRLGARSILLNLRRHGRNTRYLLIIGTNTRAMEFARRVTTSPELGYKIVGFVDDDWEGLRFLTRLEISCVAIFPGWPSFSVTMWSMKPRFTCRFAPITSIPRSLPLWASMVPRFASTPRFSI